MNDRLISFNLIIFVLAVLLYLVALFKNKKSPHFKGAGD